MKVPREVLFIGSSRKDLKAFPEETKDYFGQELWYLQNDMEPTDWKPMTSIGQGVRELRTNVGGGAYRVVYAVKIAGKVHVLHAFQKKTQKTPQKELDLAKQRYRQI
jgi:phage-related protein